MSNHPLYEKGERVQLVSKEFPESNGTCKVIAVYGVLSRVEVGGPVIKEFGYELEIDCPQDCWDEKELRKVLVKGSMTFPDLMKSLMVSK